MNDFSSTSCRFPPFHTTEYQTKEFNDFFFASFLYICQSQRRRNFALFSLGRKTALRFHKMNVTKSPEKNERESSNRAPTNERGKEKKTLFIRSPNYQLGKELCLNRWTEINVESNEIECKRDEWKKHKRIFSQWNSLFLLNKLVFHARNHRMKVQ